MHPTTVRQPDPERSPRRPTRRRDEEDAAAPQALLGERRLLLVSNREPYVRRRDARGREGFERTSGGLVTALDPVMRKSGGVWIAWEPGGDPGEDDLRHQVPAEEPRFTLRQVALTTGEVRRYYHGFANRALWPLCHYFVDRCSFDAAEWRQYVQVNERFADAVAEEARPDDLVWVHDYHFCLLPQLVRERRRGDGPIAYFLHIPFPSEELFRILPWRREVLAGLLGADLIGFHVEAYARHFLDACERLLGADVDREAGTVEWEGRTVRAAAFPIGIDVAEFEALGRDEGVRARARELRQSFGGEKIILGVDRLDYSKGIPARLHAIDALLTSHPQYCKKLSFIQVAVPSRTLVKEYRDLKRHIDELVGRVNGRHGDAEWQPVRYLFRSVPRRELVAHYLAADVAMVTPLRDGMNLVAKEYCASRVDDDGVLVLSEFTGAAERLGDGALIVNPFAVADVAAALDRGLTMPAEERRRRMAVLRRRVAGTDVNLWLAGILRELAGPPGDAH